MLELKTYTNEELFSIMKKRDNEGVKKALKSWGVHYSTTGRGADLKFQITGFDDRFKVFCITELGTKANSDYKKMCFCYYYFLCSDEFRLFPHDQQRQYLSDLGGPEISRQTISSYLDKIFRANWFLKDGFETYYYFAYKDNRIPTSKEQYCEAWRLYWNCKNDGIDSFSAASSVIAKYSGMPMKHPIPVENAFYTDQIALLIELITENIIRYVNEP